MKNFQDFLLLFDDDAKKASLKLALKLDINQGTVEAWAQIGVPLKYWDTLIKLAPDLNPQKLFELNKKLTSKK